jgi:phage terminase small subunit
LAKPLDQYGLLPRHAHFVREYLIDKNGARAARAAGYKDSPQQPRSIYVTASKLLKQPNIRAAIDAQMSLTMRTSEITAERVLTELGKLAFSNAGDFFKWDASGVTLTDSDDLTPEQKAAVSSIKHNLPTERGGGSVELKLHDKHAPLVTLARHLNLFPVPGDNAQDDPFGGGLNPGQARNLLISRLAGSADRVTVERVTERVTIHNDTNGANGHGRTNGSRK